MAQSSMLKRVQVQEIVIDYSTCLQEAQNTTDPNETFKENYIPAERVTNNLVDGNKIEGAAPQWRRYKNIVTYSAGIPNADPTIRGGVNVTTDVCQIQFQIPNDIGPPVYFYYRLTNFYQNHRRYVKSLDTDQLLGKNVTSDTIEGGNCDPLRLQPGESGDPRKPYYPCGLIANSFFNDTYNLSQVVGDGDYRMINSGISWDSDKKLYGKYGYPEDQIAVPPNWAPRWGDAGYTRDNPPPDISLYEEFQVWMRTAGLPAFSKLAMRNDNDVMRKGRYQVDINFSAHQDLYMVDVG